MSDFLSRTRANAARKRAEQLDRLGLQPGLGVTLKCPVCGVTFWARIPQEWRYDIEEAIAFACVAACGGRVPIECCDPLSRSEIVPDGFDIHTTCSRCKIEYAAMGALVRCPGCAIETARQAFQDIVHDIQGRAEAALAVQPSRADLESMLSNLVSRFDGVMRWMCDVAIHNLRSYAKYRASVPDPSKAFWHIRVDPDEEISRLQQVSSFQDIRKLRQSSLVGASEQQWAVLTLCFAKRHLVIHKLGVVDAQYLARTGDTRARLGAQVPLSIGELLQCAHACNDLVKRFFGGWLS